MDNCEFSLFCSRLRLQILKMISSSHSSHIGSCFSCVELLATLYLEYFMLNRIKDQDPQRDRLIMSKGHASAALYALLGFLDFFPKEQLECFCQKNGILQGHVDHKVNGVEYSSGSLGHGVSVGCGLALAAQREKSCAKIVVLISDGELNEGSTWEGLMFAAHHQLSSLTIMIDFNRMQSLGFCNQIINLEPLVEKLKAFNLLVLECDGHDKESILNALNTSSGPKVIIAHTIKGKGVSFMENNLLWHYRHPENPTYQKAFEELTCAQLALKL